MLKGLGLWLKIKNLTCYLYTDQTTDTISYRRCSQAKNDLSHTRKPDTFACKECDGRSYDKKTDGADDGTQYHSIKS